MAVVHENTFVFKSNDEPNFFSWMNQYRIFPSRFIFRWWITVPIKYLELYTMYMKWMCHPTSYSRTLVGDFPYLSGFQIYVLIDTGLIHNLIINAKGVSYTGRQKFSRLYCTTRLSRFYFW